MPISLFIKFIKFGLCCRNHDITMHKADAVQKNEFLQDLDKNDVSSSDC